MVSQDEVQNIASIFTRERVDTLKGLIDILLARWSKRGLL